MSRRLAALALPVLFAASGCGELRDLWALRSALAERYESSGVHLAVEGGVRTLTVSIGRPDLTSLSPEAQVALAYEAARFTHATYARASRVDVYELELEHLKPRKRLIPVNWKLSYRFDPAELQ